MKSEKEMPEFRWDERHRPLDSMTEKREWWLRVLKRGRTTGEVFYISTDLYVEYFPAKKQWRVYQKEPYKVGKPFQGRVLLNFFPCEPELRDFKLADVMAFTEATYKLRQTVTE